MYTNSGTTAFLYQVACAASSIKYFMVLSNRYSVK